MPSAKALLPFALPILAKQSKAELRRRFLVAVHKSVYRPAAVMDHTAGTRHWIVHLLNRAVAEVSVSECTCLYPQLWTCLVQAAVSL